MAKNVKYTVKTKQKTNQQQKWLSLRGTTAAHTLGLYFVFHQLFFFCKEFFIRHRAERLGELFDAVHDDKLQR